MDVRLDLILLHLGYSGRKVEKKNILLIHKLLMEELGNWWFGEFKKEIIRTDDSPG